MTHTCHAPGCDKIVPPRMFACYEHWKALPVLFRAAIWAEYRIGQEDDKKPSLRYCAIQRMACAQLAFKPLDEEAARVTAQLYIEGAAYRLAAIRAGFGDPFTQLPAPYNREPMTDVPGDTPQEILAEMVRRINSHD